MATEIVFFGPDGKIVKSCAHYAENGIDPDALPDFLRANNYASRSTNSRWTAQSRLGSTGSTAGC